MKKIFFFVLLSISLYSNAQIIDQQVNFNTHKKQDHIIKSKTKSIIKEKIAGDTLWSEDFSNGISNWNLYGSNSSVWIYDLSGPGGFYTDVTILPQDHNSNLKTSNYIINSPSVENGFADFIADEYGTQNNYPQLDGILESPSIDLTNINTAELSFYHSYRLCCVNASEIKISISTNNFLSSIDLDVSKDVSLGTASGTVYKTINLSSFLDTATNKSNFKIRFDWNGYDSYFWQIDDIVIKEVPDYDLQLSSLYLQDIFQLQAFEQTSIPQYLADTLNISAIVSNNGGNTIPTNAYCELNIYNHITNEQIESTSGGTLSAHSSNDMWTKDTLIFYSGIDLSNFEKGTFRVEVILKSSNDDNAMNDTLIRTFNITDGFYGQRNFETGITNGSDGYFGESKIPFTVGNIIYIPGDSVLNLYGVKLSLYKNQYYSTSPNTEVTFNTYEVTINGSNNITYTDIESPRIFNIADTSLPSLNGTSKEVYFDFNQAVDLSGEISLDPNKYYLIGINHLGGSDSLTFAKSIGDEDNSSVIFIKENGTSGNYIWDWLGDQALLELDFTNRSTNSIKMNNTFINNINIYPNPTSGETSVTFSLANASKVSVNVMDITGKIIYTENEANKSEGKHTLNINASEFNSGVYYVTIITDEAQVTKKLIKK